jgi:transposase
VFLNRPRIFSRRPVLKGLPPWTVARAELSVDRGRVDVWVQHPRRWQFSRPECDQELAVYDHVEQRSWRHLDSCQLLTFLHARPPRVHCPEHGVAQVRLPWTEAWSRSTTLFERLATDVLKECDVTGAARLLRLSWDKTWHLMHRAVARGLAAKPLRVPAHVGVDEKAAGRGQDYITVVADLDAGTVEHITDERRQTGLDAYFTRFSAEQRQGIQAVACPSTYLRSRRQTGSSARGHSLASPCE